jgi:hypothetical protein
VFHFGKEFRNFEVYEFLGLSPTTLLPTVVRLLLDGAGGVVTFNRLPVLELHN